MKERGKQARVSRGELWKQDCWMGGAHEGLWRSWLVNRDPRVAVEQDLLDEIPIHQLVGGESVDIFERGLKSKQNASVPRAYNTEGREKEISP